MFPWDRDLAPSQVPSPIHPLLSHCRKPPIPQRPFTVRRKGSSYLGSLQSIVKRKIIDNYPQKYIREAEAVTKCQSHPCSSITVSKTMSRFQWDTVWKQQVSPAATLPSKSPSFCAKRFFNLLLIFLIAREVLIPEPAPFPLARRGGEE